MKQRPSSGSGGRNQVPNRASTGELAEGVSLDSLIGRRVRTRWPDDNNFYEAVITDYNPANVKTAPNYLGIVFHYYVALMFILFTTFQGLHNLVYDIGSTNETWEWINLSEVYLLLYPVFESCNHHKLRIDSVFQFSILYPTSISNTLICFNFILLPELWFFDFGEKEKLLIPCILGFSNI